MCEVMRNIQAKESVGNLITQLNSAEQNLNEINTPKRQSKPFGCVAVCKGYMRWKLNIIGIQKTT